MCCSRLLRCSTSNLHHDATVAYSASAQARSIVRNSCSSMRFTRTKAFMVLTSDIYSDAGEERQVPDHTTLAYRQRLLTRLDSSQNLSAWAPEMSRRSPRNLQNSGRMGRSTCSPSAAMLRPERLFPP